MKAKYCEGCFFKPKEAKVVEIIEFTHKIWGYPETKSVPTAIVKFEDGTLEEVNLSELRVKGD